MSQITAQGSVTIRAGREKPMVNQHPWIFSGAIEKVSAAEPGDIVSVLDHRGHFLAQGYWNPRSQIQVRILTWQEEPIDQDWWLQGLRRAIQARYHSPQPQAGHRIINAENDFLPGLIVDRYNDVLILQALTLAIDQRRYDLARWLADLFDEAGMPVQSVYERSDVDVRGREGLKPSSGLLWGAEPPEYVEFTDGRRRYFVDVRKGHKTGHYLDQMANYRYLGELSDQIGLAQDARILNTFCYTGSFALHTAGQVTQVDTSGSALKLAQKMAEANARPPATYVQEDCFDYLRRCVQANTTYDVVILDPPKFAHNKQQVDKAARGYKDINLNAFRIIRPGGYLITFSCSGAISADLFQKIVFGAMVDSGRTGQIIRHLTANDDHPVALTFPEGAYLKGLVVRVF